MLQQRQRHRHTEAEQTSMLDWQSVMAASAPPVTASPYEVHHLPSPTLITRHSAALHDHFNNVSCDCVHLNSPHLLNGVIVSATGKQITSIYQSSQHCTNPIMVVCVSISLTQIYTPDAIVWLFRNICNVFALICVKCPCNTFVWSITITSTFLIIIIFRSLITINTSTSSLKCNCWVLISQLVYLLHSVTFRAPK